MSFQMFTRAANGQLRPAAAEQFVFPAGEQHLKFGALADLAGDQVAYLRGAAAEGLVALHMWADAVRAAGGTPRALIPYLPGARADRGVPFGARVYADMINAARLAQVVCFDPHSPVMPALIDNVTVVSAAPLIAATLAYSQISAPGFGRIRRGPIAGVIAPDAGAKARASEIADLLGVPLFQAAKHRDPDTGQLSGFTCEPLPITGNMLVADDICDGGGTFLGLADSTGLPADRLTLWVSHGVFSAGADRLPERFGTVVATDSISPATGYHADITIPLRFHLEQHLTFGDHS